MSSFLEPYPSGAGRAAFAPPFADHVDAVRLASGETQIIAVPNGHRFALFSFTADIFVRAGDDEVSVALPQATTSDGAAAELNPMARRIPAGVTHLAIVSPDDCVGSIAFYR